LAALAIGVHQERMTTSLGGPRNKWGDFARGMIPGAAFAGMIAFGAGVLSAVLVTVPLLLIALATKWLPARQAGRRA
jgi:hypothetical protein